MKFGQLKSKIEKNLIESYNKNNFKEELKVFKKLVLENKKFKKLFFLYDELSSNKGYDKEVGNQFINECITIYENVINKIRPKEINLLSLWVEDVYADNLYEDIDNLFSSNILNLETKIQSRKIVSENLSKKEKSQKEVINIPLNTMIRIANQTIEKHISSLGESEKRELINLLKEDDEKLSTEFVNLKSEIITKLEGLKEDSDLETTNKITESIDKINSEKYDKLTYFKLKNLKENL